jgi:hypothetical protein
MNNRLIYMALGAIVLAGAGIYAATGGLRAAEGPETKTGERTPDWAAAEKARIEQGANPGVATGQSGTNAPAGGEVPVLIPGPTPGVATVQSGENVRVQQVADGYIANIPGVAYDIVIHGTKLFTVDPDAARTTGARPEYTFNDGEDGQTLSFSRFGVDYTIDFKCKQTPPGVACITRDQAIAVAERLRVAS